MKPLLHVSWTRTSRRGSLSSIQRHGKTFLAGGCCWWGTIPQKCQPPGGAVAPPAPPVPRNCKHCSSSTSK
ncbi:Hypothetical protein FKW44_001687 [Caligus rogercresseyi]|uniref:Uncharacterized protein n=1 Tax=Caligus rogercresseyi TaxID=217165 RepID=A0A7T8QVS5_CALRO|nr:Hypothetical protein FKW44_001687 [Caligus rogercresseyi]